MAYLLLQNNQKILMQSGNGAVLLQSPTPQAEIAYPDPFLVTQPNTGKPDPFAASSMYKGDKS